MEPTFHALMISIYCISVTSLDEAECLVRFNAGKVDLLARFRSACQHALSDCGHLRSKLTHALRRQLFGKHTSHAWETMTSNFEAHVDCLPDPALMILAKSVLPASDARKSGRDYVE